MLILEESCVKWERDRDWLGVLSEACGVGKEAVSLGVKYLNEMEMEQVKILRRDEKKQTNFLVHCKSLFSFGICSHFISNKTEAFLVWTFPCPSIPSNFSLPFYYEDFFLASYFYHHLCLFLTRWAELHKYTQSTNIRELTSVLTQARPSNYSWSWCPCFSSPLIGSNRTLPQWLCPHLS